MRKLLTILLLFCFFSLRAQYPEYMPEFKVMNTKADIKNHLAINGSVVLLRGLDTLNDGAGGWYEFNSTSIATPNDTTVFQVTGVTTGRWLRMLVGGGSQVTIEGDTIIINNIKIRNVLKIPLTDTTHAKKGCANIIYDTILEHFFGDVCLNGVHSAWQCFDCGTVVRAGTNVSVTGSGTSGSPYIVASDDSDAFHTTFQLNDSTYVIRRPNGTADTIVISGIATGGGGGGIGTITEIRATNNYGQTWTITNPDGAITTLSLILDTTLYSTRANVDSKTITLNQGTNITITGNPTQNLGQNPSWTIAAAGGTGLVHAYAPLITSGDTVMRRYNVLHYGADPTGVADATVSIQNAINAADAAGGGEVFFPNGTYLIGGAIQTSVGGLNPNSQLYIPFRAFSSTARTHITLKGETKPPASSAGGGLLIAAATMPVTTGVILKTSLTVGAAGAAVIGTMVNGAAFNESMLSVENMIIQMKNNPAGAGPVIGGISYRNGASLICKNVIITIDTSGYRSTLPQNDVTGIETSDNASETFNNLENTLVMGFRKGYTIGEHVTMNQAQVMCCFYGLYFKDGGHMTTGTRVGAYWCPYDIYVHGLCEIGNLQLDNEWQQIGKWFDDVTTVMDSASRATGNLFYTMIPAGTTTDPNKFTKSGGLHLYCLPFDVGVPGINTTNIFTQRQKIALATGSHGGYIDFQLGTPALTTFTMGDDLTGAAANNWFLYDSGFSKARLFVDASGNTNLGSTASAISTSGISIDNVGNVIFDNGKFNYSVTNHALGIGAAASGSAAQLEIKISGNPYMAFNSTTSRQAAMLYQQNGTTKWQAGMDFSNNGTADYYLYDQANSKVRFHVNTTGDVHIGGTATGTTTTVLSLLASGGISTLGTVTTAGTTGAQTINKPTGIVNFAALAQTLVVTNSLATTSSLIFATILTDDATATGIQNIVRGSGSFTIKLNAAATAETTVCFWVINAQ